MAYFADELQDAWERGLIARNEKLACLSGADFIRGEEWAPLKKTRKGWEQYGNRVAKNQAVKNPVVAFVGFRGCFRLSFAGQQEK